jgi:glucokinase
MKHKVLAIDLGGTTVKAGVVSSNGTIDKQTALPSLADHGPETVADQIVKSIYEVAETRDLSSFSGLGIATPGILDIEGITVKAPPNFADWNEFKLGEAVASRLNNPIPVKVENDANAAAIAESKFGAGRGHDNFLFVIWGTGVGGGIILNGKIYHGPHGGAGEFGHISIKYDGAECNCGNIGCIESYVGQRYLSSRAAEYLNSHKESLVWKLVDHNPDAIEPKILSEAANAGDASARKIMEEAGELLGVAIASFMNCMNYDYAIVGGGISAAGDLVFEPMNRKLRASVMAPLRPIAKVVPAMLGNNAGILGAAGLVL